MAFPTTSTLDSFNRADENPLSQSGAWDGPIRTSPRTNCRLVSNAIARATTGSTSENYRVGTSFTEAEAYCTIGALTTVNNEGVDLAARIQSVESANVDYYTAELVRRAANDYDIDVYRVINAVFTSIASVATNLDPQVGDKFGMEVTGTGATVTIRVYMDTGSGWAQVGSDVSDTDASRIVAAGPIGVVIGGATSNAWRLDDFGGGEVVAGATTSLLYNPRQYQHLRSR